MVDSQSITKQMVNCRMWREWRRRMLKKRKVAVRRKQQDMWNKKVLQKVCFWLLLSWIYCVFSHDVTAAIFVSQNNETAAMLSPKPVLWELNSFLMQTLSFVPINLHRCWPREGEHRIDTAFAFFNLFGAQWKKKHPNSISQKCSGPLRPFHSLTDILENLIHSVIKTKWTFTRGWSSFGVSLWHKITVV